MPRQKFAYCWKCADRFPMSELVEDDDPYIKDEDDPNDKNYQCRPCAAEDDDTSAGRGDNDDSLGCSGLHEPKDSVCRSA